MPPLRILLVTETYPPEINGVAMTARRLLEGLRARGHWVGLVRPRQGRERSGDDPPHTWQVPGLPIPNYPGLRLGLPARRRLTRLMQEQQPDLVHVVTEGPLGWSAVKAARRLGLPVTSGYHTHFDQYSSHYGLGWLMPWVSRWLFNLHRGCQATFAPTPELAEQLTRRGIPNVRVLGRGVDTGLFHPERRSEALRRGWGVGEQDLACLYVGRLAPEKNLGLVAAAFDHIAARNPRARMVWVGDGPALARLRKRHPEHVFAGSRVGIELAAHYASADLFLFGSLSETWGNVIAEAMASGLPVVTYRRAAGERLIENGRNGFALPPGDDNAFIVAAGQAASDVLLRQRCGAAARRTAEIQGWEAIFERFETMLGAAVEAPGPAGVGSAG